MEEVVNIQEPCFSRLSSWRYYHIDTLLVQPKVPLVQVDQKHNSYREVDR
jgi:hypothetical protein